MTGPYSVPYSVGAGGNGGAGSNNVTAGAGNAGGATNFSGPAAFTTNGGNGGNGGSGNSPGSPGSPGNTAPGNNLTVPTLIQPAYIGGAGNFGTSGALVVSENTGT
jgi:hypothetical protein